MFQLFANILMTRCANMANIHTIQRQLHMGVSDVSCEAPVLETWADVIPN